MCSTACLHAEDNRSFILGEESLPIADPKVRGYAGWLIAKNGRHHPQVCSACGTVLRRFPITRFKLRSRSFDLSLTYDGYYVVSSTLARFLEKHYGVSSFHPVPGTRGFMVLDLSQLDTLSVDRQQSGTRESETCPSCTHPYYRLLGRIAGRPPVARAVVFLDRPTSGRLYRSDMQFGSTHGRSPLLVIHPRDAQKLEAERFRGLMVEYGGA
jgi:hypothetical protein